MLKKNCGKLLYNAVRETLETMAFADVIPCSIKVAGEEFAQDDDFNVANGAQASSIGDWGNALAAQAPADVWGTATPTVNQPEASWGDSPEPTLTEPPVTEDAWGTPGSFPEVDDDAAWGNVTGSGILPTDPWGDSHLADACMGKQNCPKEADFDKMVDGHSEWCWACMKVNSPDVHSVWLVIPQSLAHALMVNMYAGEEMQLDEHLVKDLIAELTNVLGGRLMLLLEEMGGKFTLTVPDIGFGMPNISDAYSDLGVVCKVVVDSEHPVIVALRFNHGGVLEAE